MSKQYKITKTFQDGENQVVCLPDNYRTDNTEFSVCRDGDRLILSPIPKSWDEFFSSESQVTEDFMQDRVDPPAQERSPL